MTVLISPERMKAIIRKVIKNITAVPKSLISTRKPTLRIEITINEARLFFVCKTSRVDAPTKIYAIFANSEGWTDTGPRTIQFFAPLSDLPSTSVDASISSARMAMAIFHFITLSGISINQSIKEYRNIRLENLRLAALTGYERLAFGSIADSIKLLYMENPQAEMLEKMDLYMISEIKRPKEGAMEIKFFDRLKALEKICEVQQNPEETCMPFYKALEKSAGIFNGDEVSSDDAD